MNMDRCFRHRETILPKNDPKAMVALGFASSVEDVVRAIKLLLLEGDKCRLASA